MRKLPFKPSSGITLGVELEYQIIDPMTYDLISKAKDLIRLIEQSQFKELIKPEITQSMIEINTSIHYSPELLYSEILEIHDFLIKQAEKLGILFAGGGTHPFQKWPHMKIFPSKRFKKLSHEFKYLSKRATVFGFHIHIGCRSPEESIYLTHAIARFVPQLIAMAASSPFIEGIDTGFQCARLNIFLAYPSSGIIPWLTTWDEFSKYFYKMRRLGLLKTMKDVYWDVRPKPEFGTIEIRVCDTPLTVETATMIAAYIQTLATYLLETKAFSISKDLYYLYHYNRFQSCRYGFEGRFINPENLEETLIGDDILSTFHTIEAFAKNSDVLNILKLLRKNVEQGRNGAKFLRDIFKKTKSLPRVVHEQCKLWSGRGKII